MIPVAPAAHYSCGGIKTDEWGRTSSKIYMHAVNVPVPVCMAPIGLPVIHCWKQWYLHIVVIWMQLKKSNQISFSKEDIPDWNAQGTSEPKEMILITQSLKELQLVMSDYVGIVRNDIRLQRAIDGLDLLMGRNRTIISKHILFLRNYLSLRNMITVGYLIVKGAASEKKAGACITILIIRIKSELVQNIVL